MTIAAITTFEIILPVKLSINSRRSIHTKKTIETINNDIFILSDKIYIFEESIYFSIDLIISITW